jgi:hypothetical protein
MKLSCCQVNIYFFTKSSLDLYQNCFVKIGRQYYLCDNDFRSCGLKLLARTKTIPLKKYLYRMNMSQSDVCDLCNAEVGEDLEHVFFDCRRNPSEVL